MSNSIKGFNVNGEFRRYDYEALDNKPRQGDFLITVTEDNSGNFTGDKTYQEIYNAVVGGESVSLTYVNSVGLRFTTSTVMQGNGSFDFFFYVSEFGDINHLQITTDNEWDLWVVDDSTDYENLSNKPQIDGTALSGNKTAAQLGLIGQSTLLQTTGNSTTNTMSQRAITQAISGGGAVEFVATYGVTTSAEIEAAYQAGKIIKCVRDTNGKHYEYALSCRQSATLHDFGCVLLGSSTQSIITVYCDNDTWHGSSINVAPVASPAFSGTPTAPTAAAGTNTTQIATTAFVQTAVGGRVASDQGIANAGKFLVVGNDGIVAPVTMQTWSGGSY